MWWPIWSSPSHWPSNNKSLRSGSCFYRVKNSLLLLDGVLRSVVTSILHFHISGIWPPACNTIEPFCSAYDLLVSGQPVVKLYGFLPLSAPWNCSCFKSLLSVLFCGVCVRSVHRDNHGSRIFSRLQGHVFSVFNGIGTPFHGYCSR